MHVPLLKWREDSFPCFLRKFLSEFDLHNSLALFHTESNVTLQSPCTCNLSDFLSSHECRTRCFKLSPVDGVLEKSPSVPTRINFTWKIYSSKQLGLSQPWERGRIHLDEWNAKKGRGKHLTSVMSISHWRLWIIHIHGRGFQRAQLQKSYC